MTIIGTQLTKPWNYTFHIVGGHTFDYKLPISLRMDKLKSLQDGIEILSASDISVLCLNYQSSFLSTSEADGYLALPTGSLGLIYIVPSFQPYNSAYRTNIAVISAHSNNTIIVFPNKNAVIYYRGLWYDDNSLLYITIVLKKREALYISGSSDLSGTIIVGGKPITVITGVTRSRLSTRPHFLEAFLLPSSLWGYRYILTSVGKTSKTRRDIFRIFSYQNNTIVKTAYWIQNVPCGRYVELLLEKDLASFVNCSKPCQVTQYIQEVTIGGRYAAPSMIVLPSEDQFLSYYRVVLPYGSKYYDSITIMIENDKTQGLYANGINFNSLDWKRVIGTKYVWTFVSFSGPSIVTVYHNSSAVKFGLLVFGWDSGGASYAYPGGYALRNHSDGNLLVYLFVLYFQR